MTNRQQVEDFVVNEVLTSLEVQEVLNVNRQRISQLLNNGRLKPIKKIGKTTLFLKSDIKRLEKELGESRKKYRPFET